MGQAHVQRLGCMQSVVCLGKCAFGSLKLQRWVVSRGQALERAPNGGGDKKLTSSAVLGAFTKAK